MPAQRIFHALRGILAELLIELKQRQARIRYLEIEIATARRTPAKEVHTAGLVARDRALTCPRW